MTLHVRSSGLNLHDRRQQRSQHAMANTVSSWIVMIFKFYSPGITGGYPKHQGEKHPSGDASTPGVDKAADLLVFAGADFFGRTGHQKLALVDEGHLVGDAEGGFHVVADDDAGDVETF